MKLRMIGIGAALALSLWASAGQPRGAAAQKVDKPQTILPPGMYLLQTRTRSGTCADAPRTGYVTSMVATLDGVPGSRQMTLKVVNSKWWPRWDVSVAGDDTVLGNAVMFGGKDTSKGTSRFEVKPFKDRLQGTGSREYPGKVNGKPTRCTLLYDVLLKPMD